MLHKIYDLFGWKRGQTLEDKEQEVADFMDKIMDDNTKLMQQNTKLMKENTEMKEEKEIPPLKVILRNKKKKRGMFWGLKICFIILVQTILVASGKQRTARRHMIACLKELEYTWNFRFLKIEENEESDSRKF